MPHGKAITRSHDFLHAAARITVSPTACEKPTLQPGLPFLVPLEFLELTIK